MLYRKLLAPRDRSALAFFTATELPLVVAITTSPSTKGTCASTAAALVGAAMVSTLIYPLVGLALRRKDAGAAEPEPALG